MARFCVAIIAKVTTIPLIQTDLASATIAVRNILAAVIIVATILTVGMPMILLFAPNVLEKSSRTSVFLER